MHIFPAIDLYGGKAVRLYKGDYKQMTVYSEDPLAVAKTFAACGAEHIHLVDLEGAKTGEMPNFETIKSIAENTDLFVEVGGGIRSMAAIEAYLAAGVDRVILGTAAVRDEAFLIEAVRKYGEHIAVGVDLKDGNVAVSGWTEKTDFTAEDFCRRMDEIGVATLICTDISKDGAMNGTNRALYRTLPAYFRGNVIASGGVSSMDDVRALAEMELYGAIIGKAYYVGAIDLSEAVAVGKKEGAR